MKEKNLTLIEQPAKKKIVEQRKLMGQLKVAGAWYLWSGLHQLLFSFLLGYVLTFFPVEESQDYEEYENFMQIAIAGILTPTLQMHLTMSRKAKQRWADKYGI
ncbi:hypothetical protein [Scytonema sp. NUACC26]|uniref:hypothetical protein n=1 Tax=Scytonema sp. NUACC26 TaxID=3140176 RepID=UPI0034DBB4E9